MVRYSERQTMISNMQRLIALSTTQTRNSSESIGVCNEASTNHQLEPFDTEFRLLVSIVFGATSSQLGLNLDQLLVMYGELLSQRYLRHRYPVPKREPPFDFLMRLDDGRFRQEARMNKNSFRQIVMLIREHEVFSNYSTLAQAPVDHQLLIFLAKVGRFGNGSSVGILARHFGLSEGSISLYCTRCLVALMALEHRVVYWPSSEERKMIANRINEEHGFEGCVGFVDGTLFPVYARPSIHGEDFYSRKGYYGMAGMVVCDDKKRVRFMDLGWPGAVHDMRVWSNSKLGTKPAMYFGQLEFLLADSGYMLCDFLLPTYKRIRGHRLSEMQVNFNTRVAQCRSVNEHCIGLLKGRFQSLWGMRMDIAKRVAAKTMVLYIRCATILHNLLIEMNDPEDDWDLDIQAYDSTDQPVDEGESVSHGYDTAKDRREYHCNKFWNERQISS